MHASIACLLLYEDYVWVSLGNAMKAKQSKGRYTWKRDESKAEQKGTWVEDSRHCARDTTSYRSWSWKHSLKALDNITGLACCVGPLINDDPTLVLMCD
jgi:hypothetical protein